MTQRFLGFAVFSGIGWLLDVASTTAMVNFGVTPFVASLVGAAAAVTFVYVVSRIAIFDQQRLGTLQDYALYVAWQAFAILGAALLVATISYLLEPAAGRLTDLWADHRFGQSMPAPLALATGAGKVMVTPLTLTANFFFMKWLIRRGSPITSHPAMGQRP